jgi:hypothetical protein
VLTERGVADYPLEQCRDDYGMALLLPASRLATAVGIHPGLTANAGRALEHRVPALRPSTHRSGCEASSSSSTTASPLRLCREILLLCRYTCVSRK